jgi:membrane dipeptidase
MIDSIERKQLISAEARLFHNELLVFDGHSDLLMPVTAGRQELREAPDRARITHWQCTGQYSVPGFRDGNVSAQVCAVFIDEPYLAKPLHQAAKMVAAFSREIRANPTTLVPGRTAGDILAAKANGQTALVLALEGAEPLESDVDLIDAFYEWGVRFIGLTHSRRNLFADGTQQDIRVGGLTRLGFAAVERMQKLGIVVDLAHLGAPGFWDVIEATQQPVVVTHTLPATEAPGYRERFDAKHPAQNVTKLEAIAKTGGVVGVLFYSLPTLDAIAREIEFVIERVGEDYISLGSDFYGRDASPHNMNDIGDLPNLTQHLLARGHSRERIAKIMGGNLLRVFKQVCG